jgi:hypothetical protein
MRHSCLVVVFALTGCTAHKLALARSAVHEQTQCPETQLNVTESGEGWWVDGCGSRYLCQVPQGPCAENLTLAQRLIRARTAFSRETGCALPDVAVSDSPRGLVAQGCGRYSVCVSYDGPCVPSRPPSCTELAQERYDSCIEVARKDGQRDTYWYGGRYAAAASIAQSVIAGSQAQRLMDECRHRFDAESSMCVAAR